jgi:ferrous iron transport protein B
MKRIALVGNPNAGKTCLFNNLTGLTQHVANYPGVTVSFTEGKICSACGEEMIVVDLPGTYSLTAYSDDEVVTRDFVLKEKPEALLVVVDASNLERNLYFTVQLIELGIPMIVALNMVDVAEKHGIKVDSKALSDRLGIPVIPTVATKNVGMEELKVACFEVTASKVTPKPLSYTHELEMVLLPLVDEISNYPELIEDAPANWVALKLLEQDEIVVNYLAGRHGYSEVANSVKQAIRAIYNHSHEDSITAVSEARYAIANGLNKESVTMSEEVRQRLTDQIDRFLCNRFLGPVFLGVVIYCLFSAVFQISTNFEWIPLFNGDWTSPVGVISLFFDKLSSLVGSWHLSPMLTSLLQDGVIGGVGGVLGFAPLIFFMFLFISFLEDTGYIARIAFILDRLLRVFGLQGKSILALLISGGISGGCAVPGIMATRTLRERKDRLITILVAPMMTCGAKLPVFLVLVGAFFAKAEAEMMFLIWILSWVFVLIGALFLRKFVVKGEQTPFIMELPVYHLPSFKAVLMHTWERTWEYVKKAGTIVLAIGIIIWASMYYPREDEITKGLTAQKAAQVQLSHSYAGKFGRLLEPISRFAGFTWKDNIALVGGWAAKEVVVGTMGTIYAMGELDSEIDAEVADLSTRLKEAALVGEDNWGPLKAFVMIIFVMIYAPCVVTLAVIKQETGTWKWAVFSTVWTTTVAYIVAVIIFQVGSLFVNL